MVNARGQLKVADFGISRSLGESMSSMTVQRNFSGTLVYMSPQQLQGEPSVPADDIYAIGATLYELLTTRPPFFTGDIPSQVHGKTPATIMDRRKSLGVTGGEVPLNWETAIARCLAKEPADRPDSAGAVAVELGLVSAADVTFRTPQESVPAPELSAFPPSAPAMPPPLQGAPTGMPAGNTTQVQPALIPVGPFVRFRKAAIGIAAVAVIGAIWFAAAQAAKARGNAARVQEAERLRLVQEDGNRAAAEQARREQERLASARGALIVKADPPGAQVRVGNAAPQGTPAIVSDLKVGTHEVTIFSEGYDSVIRTIEIQEKTPVDLGTITLARSKGMLKIESIPSQLDCEVRSVAKPTDTFVRQTPFEKEVTVGEYEVALSRPGWPTQKKTLTVSKGAPQEAKFRFAGASYMIASEPPGAEVKREGQLLGTTPFPVTDQPPGPVKYTLSLAGYKDELVAATVEPGKEPALPLVTLTKTKPAAAATAGVSGKKPSARSAQTATRRSPASSERPSQRRSEDALEKTNRYLDTIRNFKSLRGF